MEGYKGETIVDMNTHPTFSKYTAIDWAMLWIERYSWIDGAHHKTWVFDQISRILKGTNVILKEASWENGHSEYRYDLDEPSDEYNAWVKEMLGNYDEENEEYEYSYDTGIAP
jgi:hypothetical protein